MSSAVRMSPEQALKAAYVHLAAYYGQKLLDVTLVMYVEDLAGLPPQDVLLAMRKLRREPGRRTCPLPADIRNLVAPDGPVSDLSIANDIAARIGNAMSRYGYTNSDRAEQHIGPVGWQVVSLLGGWRHICNTVMTDDMRTFHAQCRELARAQLEMERRRPKGLRPSLPGAPARQLGDGRSGMQSAADILRRSDLAPR